MLQMYVATVGFAPFDTVTICPVWLLQVCVKLGPFQIITGFFVTMGSFVGITAQSAFSWLYEKICKKLPHNKELQCATKDTVVMCRVCQEPITIRSNKVWIALCSQGHFTDCAQGHTHDQALESPML